MVPYSLSDSGHIKIVTRYVPVGTYMSFPSNLKEEEFGWTIRSVRMQQHQFQRIKIQPVPVISSDSNSKSGYQIKNTSNQVFISQRISYRFLKLKIL